MAEEDGTTVVEPGPDLTSGDSIAEALGGLDVKSFIAGEEPTPPPLPESEPETVSAEEVRALQEEVKNLRENANQQHSNWNYEHMARKNAQAMAESIQGMRQQEAAQAQAAAAMQPPNFEVDWAEAYDDPEKLGKAVQEVALRSAEWGRNQAMGLSHPAVQQFQQMQAAFGPIQEASVEFMLDRGDRVLREKHGVEDFSEYRDRVKQEFSNGGAQGIAMMSDPENIVSVYGMMAIKDGKAFNPVEKSKAPIHAGGGPSFSTQTPNADANQTPPELRNMWSRMSGAFPGIDPPTQAELEEMGISWKP
jgi:hypothetical protein